MAQSLHLFKVLVHQFRRPGGLSISSAHHHMQLPLLYHTEQFHQRNIAVAMSTSTTSKAKNKKAKGKLDSGEQGKAATKTGSITESKGQFLISLQVKPGAKVSAITDVSDEAVSIAIAAPPVDGEANIAIVKYFSELLGIRKGDISLKGGKSRQKTLIIDNTGGTLTEGALLESLRKG